MAGYWQGARGNRRAAVARRFAGPFPPCTLPSRVEYPAAMETKTIVGQGAYTYEVDNSWGRRAGGVEALGVAQGVTGDSQDRVYIFQRSPTTEVLVFDRDGKLLNRWGDGQFVMPHGIWCSPNDELYITD